MEILIRNTKQKELKTCKILKKTLFHFMSYRVCFMAETMICFLLFDFKTRKRVNNANKLKSTFNLFLTIILWLTFIISSHDEVVKKSFFVE